MRRYSPSDVDLPLNATAVQLVMIGIAQVPAVIQPKCVKIEVLMTTITPVEK